LSRRRNNGWPPTGFGSRLRELREQRALKQGELALRAGLNPFTLSKLERGLQEPAWPLVLAVARALGVDVNAFVVDTPAELEDSPAEAREANSPRSVRKPAKGKKRPRKRG
jgi:transcriptional regulator with XRE-family HTH domain